MSGDPRSIPASALPAMSGGAAAAQPRFSARYVATLAILVLAALSLQFVARTLGYHFRKLPVPLKAPFTEFRASQMAPDYELAAQQPPRFSEDVLQTLGTREYLSSTFVNLNVPEDDPTRMVHVSVTYYTGKPDQVPHIPDTCVVAGGGMAIASRNVSVQVAGVGAPGDLIPLRLIAFQMPGERGPLGGPGSRQGRVLTVAYFFRTNDLYRLTRNEVRLAQSSPFVRYAYYSKIEMMFTDRSGRRLADLDETEAAAPRFLSRFLPVLLRDHLQSIEEMNAARTAREGG